MPTVLRIFGYAAFALAAFLLYGIYEDHRSGGWLTGFLDRPAYILCGVLAVFGLAFLAIAGLIARRRDNAFLDAMHRSGNSTPRENGLRG
jgi:hypothetical protein